MHGEYKEPGGKLVVVDLEVRDGRLRGVEVSGDFFLQPEETLWRMRDAIDGAPADASREEIERRVARAAEGAELIGISPAGVAIAVRRALDEAAG